MAEEESAARAARALRRDLGLRPAADLRSARGHRDPAARAPEDGLHRLPAPRGADQGAPPRMPEMVQRPYVLVTTGGGGDGEGLIDWVVRAYEHDPLLPYPALLVLGPFMQPERQAEFMDRAERLKRVDAITFHGQLEALVSRAAAVVAMGGYNTFCEVLSLDKPTPIGPRTAPRLEQHIRASRAAELGLVSMLSDDGSYDPAAIAAALRALPRQGPPSEVFVPGLLQGLPHVARRVPPSIELAAGALPPPPPPNGQSRSS